VTRSGPDSPFVSVVIPMFNGGTWIHEALESVAMQTHAVHECIVVDDGSTDQGPGIVREVQRAGDLPLDLITIEHGGVSVARNTGIEAASGHFIALLDADDVWWPRKLEYQVEMIQTTKASMCTTAYALFHSDSRRVRGVVSARRPDRAVRRWLALEGNGLGISSTAIFRRSEIERFDSGASIGEDVEFALRMQEVGELVTHRRVLVGVRTHEGQAHRHLGNLATDLERLYEQMPIERLGLRCARRCRSNLDAHVGYSLLIRGHLVGAARRFAKVLKRDPRRLITLPAYALGRRLVRRSRGWFVKVPIY